MVVGLSYDTNESVLNNAFGKHGEIIQGDITPTISLRGFYIPEKFF